MPFPVKKMASDVDNLLPREKKRYQLICQIQAFLNEGCSYREIAKRLGISRKTIAKYRTGNPTERKRQTMRQVVK
jgi:DNA-binding NarL/FixJ family response regulator